MIMNLHPLLKALKIMVLKIPDLKIPLILKIQKKHQKQLQVEEEEEWLKNKEEVRQLQML
nr:MAG TPA: hypothetical protein [Crassvirales sp.]